MKKMNNTTSHHSGDYDQNVRQTIPYYELIQQEVIHLVKRVHPEVKSWVDTGCGTGYLVKMAIQQFPNTHFILADPSIAMLNQAKKRLTNIKNRRVTILPPVSSQELSISEGFSLPQVVTAIQCHHYLNPVERQRAIGACYRLLEHEGIFITTENITPLTERGVEIGLDQWKHFQLSQGRSQSTVENHLKRLNTHYFPLSIIDHLSLLRSVGFRTVEMFWLSRMQAGFYGIR